MRAKCLSGFGVSADDAGASTEATLATTGCTNSSSELAKGKNVPFDLLGRSAQSNGTSLALGIGMLPHCK